MESIHHTCICTGQRFTFKEWCEWLETNGYGCNTIPLSHGSFNFNIHDVCLTPNTSVDWKNKYCRICIETAQSPNGRWSYGLNYNFHNSGGGHGAFFVGELEQGYSSEKEAVFAALEALEEYANRELSNNSYDYENDDGEEKIHNSAAVPYIRSALNQIASFKQMFNPMQLSLF